MVKGNIMKAAIIESGTVTNVALVSSADFAQSQGWIVSEVAKIGDSYDAETGEFTTPEPAPTPIPQVVTMRQARLALLQQGLLASIQPAIDSLDEPHRSGANIEWEYSQEVERNRPFVELLSQALGLTDDDLDALFTLASTL